jgi:hypothetical protein
MAEKMGPIISTNGLVFCVDAANPQSINFAGSRLTDLSNGYVGQNSNNPNFVNSGITSYVSFDGTDDSITFNEIILSKTEYTKTVWYYIPTAGSGSTNNLISGGGDSNHYFYTAGSIWLRAGHNGLDSFQTVTSQNIGKAIQFDKWNFGAVTYSSTNGWKLYVADSLADVDSSTVTFNGTQYISLARYGGGNLLNGRIAQVSIYNRALSPFEVYQNFNATKGRYGIPDIVTGGLVLNLDAGNPYSYNPDNTGSTVWTDVTYNTTGGTLLNGTSYTGGTMTFDGTNDWITMSYGSAFTYGTEDFTIECWFKDTSLTTVPYSVLYSQTVSGVNYFLFGVDTVGVNGRVSWIGTLSGGGTPIYASGSYLRNTWNHAVASRINGIVTVYLNTNAGTPTSNTVDFTNTTYVPTIGDESHHGSSNSWRGDISVLRIYKSKGLTQAEITQNFNALRGRYGI